MPDDLDKGFHALVSRYATHAIRNGEALSQSQPDLAQLIAPPEVTFAAYLADGSIVLCCPDGLPEALEGVAEVLEPAAVPDTVPPEPDEPSNEIWAKLDQLGKKLDRLQRDRLASDQIADRLDSLEYAVLDGLTTVRKREEASVASPPEAQDLSEVTRRLDAIWSQVANRPDSGPTFDPAEIVAAVSASEDRLLSMLQVSRQDADVPRLVERIEQGIQKIAASVAARSDVEVVARRLEDRLEALASRPVPQGDLVAQRQGFANFMKSMGTVIRRLDEALDRISDVQSLPAVDLALATIDDHLHKIPQRLEALLDVRLDMAPLLAELTNLKDEIGRPMREPQETAAALQQLSAQVEALARRPAPAPDLTYQRQNYANFATVLGAAVQRLESASQTIEAQPGLTPILARIETLHSQMNNIGPVAAAQARAIEALSDQFARLAQPSLATVDIVHQRQSFAQFATAIGSAIMRLEALSDGFEIGLKSGVESLSRIENPVSNQDDPASVAAGTTIWDQENEGTRKAAARPALKRVSPGTTESVQAFQAAQDSLPNGLRYEIAEAMALQMKALAEKP